MNKEEMERKYLEKAKEYIEYEIKNNKLKNGCTNIYIFQTEVELLLKHIGQLERKEAVLDKVEDKLKEDINRFEKIIKDRRIWGEQKVDFKKYKNYATSLLNIIEGEKNERI